MSTYLDQVKIRDGDGVLEDSILADHVEQWPNLCQALGGIKQDDGKWQVGPATLMIFLEGGIMKFCLSPKYFPKVCFGVVSDPTMVLDSVEHALTTGKCEWKLRGRKN